MGMTPPDLKTYFLIQESCYNAAEDKGRGWGGKTITILSVQYNGKKWKA